MAKGSPIKTSWNAGEWSPLLEGHINLQNWNDSSLLMQNLLALKQGPAVRRGGFRFVKEVKDSSANTALIPFEFSIDQEYVIEAGETYFRFYTSRAAITEATQSITNISQADPAVVTYSGADNYANGDEVYISGVTGMTEVNGKYYLVANVNTGANTFEITDIDGNDIDSTGYTAYSANGTIAEVYEVTSPYSASDLIDSNGLYKFQYAQSADVLYIVHEDYEVRSLVRTSDTNWAVNTIDFNDGPYLPENDTDTTLTLSGTTGSVTVTASATTGINGGDGFQSTDVGRLIRWKDAANEWTWLEITAYTSTTQVTATINGQDASATTATTSWRLGIFSETTGWPRVITFFQDRVFLGGNSTYPDRWALTRTGGYDDTTLYFAPTDVDGTVTDDAGITGTLPSNQVSTIQWAGTDDKGLLVGTASKEFVIRPSANSEVLTPSNAKADKFSNVGAAYIQATEAESGTLFIQRARRKLQDIIYSFEKDSLKPRDLTISSEHITRTGVAQVVSQQEPINTLWMRRTDGLLLGYTYYPDEAVFAAHRHPVGGTSASVKALAVVPSPDTSRQDLWAIVSRTINGVTRQYVEYQEKYWEDDELKREAFYVDSGLTLDNPLTVSGATQADPVVVTVTGHGLSNGDYVDLEDVGGMTELNGNRYIIANKTANTFELTDEDGNDVDGTGYTAYTSGGEAREAVTSVTGLDHLEGETVKVMLDGNSHPDLTVSSGAVTFANDRRGSVAQIGLGYTWAWKSQRLEAGAKDGVAQGKTKRITRFVVRLLNTLGLYYGPSATEYDEYDFNQGAAFDEDLSLFSGDTDSLPWPEGYETDGTIYLQHDGVFPAALLAVMPQVSTQDR